MNYLWGSKHTRIVHLRFNIHLFLKLGNRMFQEELNEISVHQFFKTKRCRDLTLPPTNPHPEVVIVVIDY